MFTQVLLFILGLTGYITGIVLSFISPEEMAPGQKYFRWMSRAVLIPLFLLPFWQDAYSKIISYALLLLIAVIPHSFLGRLTRYTSLFALTFFWILPSRFQPYYITRIFLYLLPEGSLSEKKEYATVFRILAPSIGIAILALLLTGG